MFLFHGSKWEHKFTNSSKEVSWFHPSLCEVFGIGTALLRKRVVCRKHDERSSRKTIYLFSLFLLRKYDDSVAEWNYVELYFLFITRFCVDSITVGDDFLQ